MQWSGLAALVKGTSAAAEESVTLRLKMSLSIQTFDCSKGSSEHTVRADNSSQVVDLSCFVHENEHGSQPNTS